MASKFQGQIRATSQPNGQIRIFLFIALKKKGSWKGALKLINLTNYLKTL
jgi:hypothetical protein